MSFIPLLFYDLIARVVPGCITIALWGISMFPLFNKRKAVIEYLKINEFPILETSDLLNFWTFLIFTVLGYIVAFIVTVPAMKFSKSKLIHKIFRIKRFSDEVSEIPLAFRENTLTELKKIASTFDSNPNYNTQKGKNKDLFFNPSELNAGTLREFIITWDPIQGNRIIRTNAEKRLCEILLFGLLFIVLLNVILLIINLSFWLYHLLFIVFCLSIFRPILKNRIRHIKYLYKATMSIWLAVFL